MLAAARELLVEQGAAGMRMELIAQRSGVHRSSIYRRWGDPAGVVADLAKHTVGTLTAPDTGSLRVDLEAMARQLAQQLDGDGATLVLALASWQDTSVQDVMTGFWESRRAALAAILSRHGSQTEPAVMLRVLAGPLHYQAGLERHAVTDDTIHAAVAAAIALA